VSKFKQILFPLILVLLTIVICFLNYTPNTFLTGWDTLHPEFNFSLNFQRLLNVWHPEQGLGDIPGHAQISDLPRIFVLYLLHFVLPLNFLRYSYIFICFIIGPLGIYFLIRFLFKKNLIAFMTTLLYIFNLSTVQQFYVPFEMFPTQWAFLPFIILFSLKFLFEKSKKNLILFSLFTLLSTPQSYAPQLWLAFFFIYVLFLVIHSFFNRQNFKKSLTLILFTLLLNAFWLIPNLFYIFSSSHINQNYRNNRLYSQEYLLKNRANGNLADSTLIKGFYLDWSVFDFNRNSFDKLMPQWKNHFNQPIILTIGYLIFTTSFLGLIISFLKKDRLFTSLSPFFIIPFVLLSSQVPIFSNFFDLLIKNSTLRESFRFIFSKLSILLLFGLVLFFSYFLSFIFQKIKSLKFQNIISTLIIICLIIYTFPTFQGQLISQAVRVKIPDNYFQFWQFMNNQGDGRILTLPLNQSSGWQYYSWGYQGSGFLWFNLKQSLLDRDSDRWSNQNEQSYQEFFNSLYSQKSDIFFNTLQKYQVKYIVIDQSIVSSSSNNNDQITFKNETDNLLKKLENQKSLIKINQFGTISIYQTNFPVFNTTTKTITNFVRPSYQSAYFDVANSSDYITTTQTNVFYPFRDLLNSNQKIDLNKLEINQISPSQWQINLRNPNNYQLQLPSLISTENLIPTSIYLESSKLIFKFPFPQEILNSFKTEFDIPKNSSQVKINDIIFPITSNSPNQFLGNVNIFINSANYLNDKNINFNFNFSQKIYLKNVSLNVHSIDFINPQNFNINLPNLPHSSGYIVAVKSQYMSGIPLRLCLKNNYSFVCNLEDELSKNKSPYWDYFLIPSTGNDLGYQLNFNNISISNIISKSTLNQVSIIPIPFNFLIQIKFEDTIKNPLQFFILNQSFHLGWLAFYFDGAKPIFLKNHVLANNWANAWELPTNINQSQIHIFFWPQILEFLGLGLTIFTLIWIFKKKS